MIASRLTAIRNELAQLSSRSVDLVAVSKTKPVESIMEAYSAGQRKFGENYVTEMVDKYSQAPEDIQWHFIGHLQSNKVSKLLTGCPDLYMVETVDSVKLATKMDQVLSGINRVSKLRVLVEVKTSNEESKSGTASDEALPIITHILQNCPYLHFSGLMTIANPADPGNSFRMLSSLAERLRADSIPVEVISMGMSGDYPLAVQLGSTEVRIGSSIFGSR